MSDEYIITSGETTSIGGSGTTTIQYQYGTDPYVNTGGQPLTLQGGNTFNQMFYQSGSQLTSIDLGALGLTDQKEVNKYLALQTELNDIQERMTNILNRTTPAHVEKKERIKLKLKS